MDIAQSMARFRAGIQPPFVGPWHQNLPLSPYVPDRHPFAMPKPTENREGGEPVVVSVVATNLKNLMEHAGKKSGRGPSSIRALAKAAEISRPTIDAILDRGRGAGIDTIERIARVYGLEAWQMLVQGLDPANAPMLREASETEKEFLRSLNEVQERLRALDRERVDAEGTRGAGAGRDSHVQGQKSGKKVGAARKGKATAHK